MLKTILDDLREAWDARIIVYELVRQQLVLRYRRTVLGYLWTLINPLLMLSITAVVFSTLLKMDLENFALFLLAGLLPWWFFSATVTQSTSVFLANEGLLKKIYIPKMVFLFGMGMGVLVDSLLAAVALIVLLVILGAPLSPAILFLPVAYFLIYLFCFGLSLGLSVLSVYMRDLQQIVTVMLQAWFFLTPVIYPLSALEGRVGDFVNLNPMTHFVDLFRAPLYAGQLPGGEVLATVVAWITVSLLVGAALYARLRATLIYRL